MNHDPGFHLSCDQYLSKGWGPPQSVAQARERGELPSADGSNPAISGHRKTGHFWRPETGVEFYLIGSCVRKVVWTLVRQLRGPHLSTCA